MWMHRLDYATIVETTIASRYGMTNALDKGLKPANDQRIT
jgi:hypothetical protein